MNRLLVATDLSPASDGAVEYALKLAAALDADVTLVAAYEGIPVPVTDPMSMVIVDGANSRHLVEEGLRQQQLLFQQYKVQPVNTLAIKGPVVASILAAADELNVGMIVVGMKARGKGVRRILGSTATALARKTSVPLLVVPEDAPYVPPANILLGNDIRPDTDIRILDLLKELVAVFLSKLYAVRIIRSGEKEQIAIDTPNPLHALDKTWDVVYEYAMGKDVDASLNEFVRLHNIQLIAMVPHRHAVPERWFLRSHTREMLFEASIPLLLLPEP